MNKLVFLEKGSLKEEPFTTSRVIAENGSVEHRTVTKLIQIYESDLKEFGRLGFEIEPLKTKGGIQNTKYYRLNEQQATLLITYMKNTLQVRNFKKNLVKQFYIMKKELGKKAISRGKAIEKRNVLTDAIDKLPDSPHKAMKYKHYTDLVYKIVLNKNTKQLREQFKLSKGETPRDYFSAEEIKRIEIVENEIAVLIGLGNDYSTIKMMLQKKYLMAI
ncbi:Rha family transcriptional regulator [Clostridium sp. WILCCON 0269]|uniref:Rha family transcriptional regulator n=1 Tax=Candidatus Clostridium eludens TaxID=3381663 RepID=A0ABW8SL41_9CLOT